MQIEKLEAQETIIRMVNAIDTKNWETAKRCFAEDVFVDYSSMNGVQGSTMKSNDLVDGWSKLLENATTHHRLSNFQVDLDGDACKVQSHVYAYHLAKGLEDWDIFGLYLYELKKMEESWKITSMTLIVHGQRGNLEFISQLMDSSD